MMVAVTQSKVTIGYTVSFQKKGTYFLYCTWGLEVIKGRRSVCTRPSQHQIVG